MLDDWMQEVVIGAAVVVGLIARARRRRAANAPVEESQAKSADAASVSLPMQASTTLREERWPVDRSMEVHRLPKSVRTIVLSRGPYSGQYARCVECTIGGRLATEVVRITPGGEDIGEPQYLWDYSVDRTIRELVG